MTEDIEELALPIAGKKRKLKRSDFEQFGSELGLGARQIANVFNRFRNTRDLAFEWLGSSFLSEQMKDAYKVLINSRMDNFL